MLICIIVVLVRIYQRSFRKEITMYLMNREDGRKFTRQLAVGTVIVLIVFFGLVIYRGITGHF